MGAKIFDESLSKLPRVLLVYVNRFYFYQGLVYHGLQKELLLPAMTSMKIRSSRSINRYTVLYVFCTASQSYL